MALSRSLCDPNWKELYKRLHLAMEHAEKAPGLRKSGTLDRKVL